MALWALPISVADAVVERSFGLSTVTSGTWIADRIRDGALDLVWAPVVAAALVVVRKSPRCWWLWVALGLGPLGAVLTALYPVAVDPLYNRFRPLAEPALRERVLRLAADAGIERPQLLVADSSTRTLKANAYVTGLGPTHRIVIWDTTLRRMANDQVVAIVAHEIGHYRLRHIWWGVALHAVGGIAVLGLAAWILPAVIERWGRSSGVRALYEPAAIPLAYVAFQVLLLAQTPAAAVVSRTMERQADAYGLRLCRNGIATARAFAAFSTLDLGDPDPPRALVAWAHTHPPLRERVARALSFVPKGYIRDGYRAPATPVARRR
jgi:STE24 endopeptidase